MISSDQRSPKISSETLTGHPERCWERLFPFIRGAHYQRLLVICKLVWGNSLMYRVATEEACWVIDGNRVNLLIRNTQSLEIRDQLASCKKHSIGRV